MATKFTLELEITDKGTLKLVSTSADKTAKSLRKVSSATDKAAASTKKHAKGRNSFNRLEKGTAGITSNSTKAFSKQAQAIGGTLVPAYATLAANVFALSAAFLALSNAASLKQLELGLIAVGNVSGQNLPRVAQGLKAITGAAISTEAAMQSVALGISAGFRVDQLKDLTKVARGASLALGRDLEDALTRLVKGTAKLEPEILDELGILVRLDDAVDKYATQLGKASTQLTQFERRQAFLQETLTQGLDKFGALAKAIDPNPYNKLGAAFNDLSKAGFGFLNTFLVPVVKLLASSPTALTGALVLFGSTIIGKIVPALDTVILK